MKTILKDKPLCILVFSGLVLRLLFFFIYQPWNPQVEHELVLNGDAVQYHYLAISILKYHNFADNVFRTPLYPTFIAILYGIFGINPYIVLLFQIILSSIGIFIIYDMAKMLTNRTVGLVAAGILAFDPHQITFASWLFSDSLFTFLFILSIYYFVKGINNKNIGNIIFSAVILGLNILNKPVVQFFPVAMILLCLIWRTETLKTKLKYAVIYLTIPFMLALPWLLRNKVKHGHFAISSIVGFNKLVYNVPLTEHVLTHKDNGVIIDSFLTKIRLENPQLKDIPLSSKNIWHSLSFETTTVYGKYADEYLSKHRAAYLKLHFMGMVKLMLNVGTQNMLDKLHIKNQNKWGDEERYSTGFFMLIKKFLFTKSATEVALGLFIIIFMMVCYFYGFAGVYFTIRDKQYELLCLCGGSILYFLLIYGELPIVRFKLPITAMYSLLAGYGFYRLHQKNTRKLKA